MATPRKKDFSGGSFPVKLEIVDVEKVKGLSNYYVYIIKVTCTNGSTYYIYRRFKQFDEMHTALEKRFPIESGSINYKDRTLPNLPSKKLIGRSAIREVTEKRLPILNEYLKSLLLLPNNIRYDSIVTRFTVQTPEDQSRPAYTSQIKQNSTLSSNNGASHRPKRPAPPSSKPQPPRPQGPPTLRSASEKPARPLNSFTQQPPHMPLPAKAPPKPLPPANIGKGRAIYSYTAVHSDELSFSEGDILSLHELADGGVWWKASFRGKKGLAPGNYVEVINKPVMRDVRDSVNDSDEWDSSDGEGEAESGSGYITYYYNDAARTMEVAAALIATPTYVQLHRAIQKQLHGIKFVLNYKDSDGDLVQLCSQQDMELLTSDATPPVTPIGRRQVGQTRALWAIYVTRQGDDSVYSVQPPR